MEPKENDTQAAATTDESKAPKKVKMVKVEVLRPFRITGENGEDTVYDNIGKHVMVPETDLPWLTQSIQGQTVGFGERLEEETEHHDMRRARKVA